ncbi:MAG: DUF5818 domain-containing protein [Bacteroidota bacterium]
MKKYLFLFVMALSLSTSFAFKKFASFTGYISCAKCGDASKESGIANHAACAAACVKGGQAVVLVTADGKIYKISNQDKALTAVGKKVNIEGSLKDNTIEIKSIKAI